MSNLLTTYLYYYIFHATTYENIVENPAAPLNIFDIILATGCHWMAELARDVMMEQPDWKKLQSRAADSLKG